MSNRLTPYDLKHAEAYPDSDTLQNTLRYSVATTSPIEPDSADPVDQTFPLAPNRRKASSSISDFQYPSANNSGAKFNTSFFPTAIQSRRHPFAKNYEPPEWMNISIHIILCLIAYPILMAFTAIGQGQSLFWSRFAVGVGCGLVGVALGVSMVKMGKNFLEAATWATLIHQSHDIVDAPGIRLRDLAANSQDSTSPWAALRLLWSRLMYSGTARRSRKAYDSRPWSLFIAFFLFLVVLAAALPFLMGRLVDIKTIIEHQRERYYETTVKADISDQDIIKANALQTTFNTFALTWTLSPFSSGNSPSAVSFSWQNDTVYLAEVASSQLARENGYGPGTFDEASVNRIPQSRLDPNTGLIPTDVTKPIEPGTLLRFPRWGIRMHCEKIEDANHYIPMAPSTLSYVFTPKALLRRLFASFGKPFPTILDQPLNLTTAMQGNDTFPETLKREDVSLSAFWWNNGVAHGFKSTPLTMGAEGYGWVTIEQVLVRLNTTYAPNSKFTAYSNESIPTVTGEDSRIGYDSVVCLEVYEPYVVEVYNSSLGNPLSTRIISQTKRIEDFDPERPERRDRQPIDQGGVIAELNSTRLASVYDTLHGNAVNQLLKDNGRDSFYVPSPTLLSFTDGGSSPDGYTSLSATAFGQVRAMADATDALPYFAGSGTTLARSYPDAVVSRISIRMVEMTCLLAGIMVLGILAGMFVPKLPLNHPKRGFELYSWLAAFSADEVVAEGRDRMMEKNMSLRDIDQRMGDLRFRFVAPPPSY